MFVQHRFSIFFISYILVDSRDILQKRLNRPSSIHFNWFSFSTECLLHVVWNLLYPSNRWCIKLPLNELTAKKTLWIVLGKCRNWIQYYCTITKYTTIYWLLARYNIDWGYSVLSDNLRWIFWIFNNCLRKIFADPFSIFNGSFLCSWI